MPTKGERERERLFNVCNAKLKLVEPDVSDVFVCPICDKEFGRECLATDPPGVSLAHIIPEALGGEQYTLACTKCNNDMGSLIESFMIDRFKAEDVTKGVGKRIGRLVGKFGNIGVEIHGAPDGEPWKLVILDEQTNPVHLAELQRMLGDPESVKQVFVECGLDFRLRNVPNRVSSAIYQSAFLLMFAQFGYEFVRDPRFAKLNEQLHRIDDEIVPARFFIPPDDWVEKNIFDIPYAIMFAKEPFECIQVFFRFQPKDGLARVIGVVLPSLESQEWPEHEPGSGAKGVIIRFKSNEVQLPRLCEVAAIAKNMN